MLRSLSFGIECVRKNHTFMTISPCDNVYKTQTVSNKYTQRDKMYDGYVTLTKYFSYVAKRALSFQEWFGHISPEYH